MGCVYCKCLACFAHRHAQEKEKKIAEDMEILKIQQEKQYQEFVLHADRWWRQNHLADLKIEISRLDNRIRALEKTTIKKPFSGCR